MRLSALDKVLRMQGDVFSSQVQRGVLIDSCLELTDTVLGTYPIEGLHGHHPTGLHRVHLAVILTVLLCNSNHLLISLTN